MIIYRATSPSGKRYVGQTVHSLERRRREHEYDAQRGASTPFHRAIRKYGADAFAWAVLCECETLEIMNRMEKEFITMYGAMVSTRGYNCRDGGDGGGSPNAETRKKNAKGGQANVASGHLRKISSMAGKARAKQYWSSMTPEERSVENARRSAKRWAKDGARERHSAKMKAKDPAIYKNLHAAAREYWETDGARQKQSAAVSAALSGKPKSAAHRAALAAANAGKKHSAESRRKMSEKRKGVPKSDAWKAAVKLAWAKKRDARK